MNNLRKTNLIQKTIIILALISTVIITLCCYRQDLEIARLVKENESLKGLVEYQKSAIADLEENLKNKWEEEKWKN